MATKAKPAKTFARTIWKLIAAEMSAQDMQQAQIAKLVGVSAVTVCADAKTPEKNHACADGAVLCSARHRPGYYAPTDGAQHRGAHD